MVSIAKVATSRSGNLFDMVDLRRPRPFVKWAGGKTSLLRTLRQFVPKAYDRYFEPFLGGGAFFFDLRPTVALLADSNRELIHCYRVVRDNPDALFSVLSKQIVSESQFYRMRGQDPAILSDIERAARFIFLNKTCFN